MPVACTVAAPSELAYVRVLAATLEGQGIPLVALVLEPGAQPAGAEPFERAAPAAVGLEPGSGLLVLPREALYEAAKARLLGHVLERGEPVLVLDPWSEPQGPLAALAPADGVALFPRADDDEPGVYRSGLVAAGGAAGRRFARWWADAPDGDELTRLDAAPAAAPVDIVRERPPVLALRGFDPHKPYWLHDREASDALAATLTDYAERLLAAGWDDVHDAPWRYATLPDGTALDGGLRDCLHLARTAGVQIGDPFTPEGAERLLAFAAGPSDAGGHWGVSRYLNAVWHRRPDLQHAFADLDGADGERFADWAGRNAREERLAAALVPQTTADGTGPAFGVNVAGYLSSTLGIAEAARLYMTALRAADVPLRMESVDPPRPPRRRVTESSPPLRPVPRDLDVPVSYPLNVVTVNAQQLPQFARLIGEDFFAGRRTVGIWAWETSVIPASWEPSFEWVDEIWTNSTYMAALIAPRSPVPVVPVPPPVIAPDPREPLALELPDGFIFLFAFDFLSTVERKNPVGVVEAFTRAFRDGEGPQLVLKAFNGDYRPEQLAQVRWAARGRSDVHVVDRWIPDAQREALMARADCYVSLHRSEGFGLTMAEAMALGKPVIATGYSGNLDFMDSSTAYLVEHRLVRVGPGVDIYPADGIWAEPDLEHAATLMRRVVEHPDEAAERGARAREDVLRRFSPAACGALARSRLEALARTAARDRERPAPLSDALAAVRDKAAYDPQAGVASTHPRDLVKKAALQAMRPYTFHQQELNQRIVTTLDELERKLGTIEAELASERRRARRAEWRLRGLEALRDAQGADPAS